MLVKVYNDNTHTYSETYKEQKIVIPPGKFIEMEAEEAVQFRGTFAPIKVDGDGNPIPSGFKMIRIEVPKDLKEVAQEAQALGCHKCGYKAANGKDLTQHTEANHADEELVAIEELDMEIKKKAKK